MSAKVHHAETVLSDRARERLDQAMGLHHGAGARAHTLESIRISAWALSQGGAVATNGRRITNRAERLIRILDLDKEDRTELSRKGLKLLESIGDIGHCGEDRWLPTPARIVPLGSVSLLVGGTPSSLFSDAIRAVLRHRSPIRFLDGADIILNESALPVQALDTWLGRPRPTLTERFDWMQRLALVSPSDTGGTWSAFVLRDWTEDEPWYSHGRRWQALDRTPDGRYLVRHKHATDGRTRYYVAQVKDRTIAGISLSIVATEDARLLSFAVDQHLGRPLKVRVTFQDGRATLEQRCAFPHAETKLLYATATKHRVSANDIPANWHFADRHLCDEVLTQLETLGIIVNRQGETVGKST